MYYTHCARSLQIRIVICSLEGPLVVVFTGFIKVESDLQFLAYASVSQSADMVHRPIAVE